MQVTTKTANSAINNAVSKGYTTYKNIGISRDMPLSYTDKNDRSTVWSLLNSDPDFNIEVAAQIVRMNADTEHDNKKIDEYSPSELVNLFARYNGSGDAAQEYGTECYNWYQDFNWYN